MLFSSPRRPGGPFFARRRAAHALELELQLELPAQHAAVGGMRQWQEVAQLVFQLDLAAEPPGAYHHRTQTMLLVAQPPGIADVGDLAVILDTLCEERVQALGNADGRHERRRTGAIGPADGTREGGVHGEQRRTQFLLHDRSDRDQVLLLAAPGLLVFEEEADIEKISASGVSWKTFSNVVAS